MISLPNGCSRSEFTIIPENWNFNPYSLSEREKKKLGKNIQEINDALLIKEWRIVYRFYDPSYKGTKLWAKQFVNKGMNKYKTLQERQEFTLSTLTELEELLKEGYNPITKKIIAPEYSDIDSDTPFPVALTKAFKKLKCAEGTKDDIRKALVHIQNAIALLKYNRLAVGEIRIRNCMLILDKVREVKIKQRDSNLLLLKSEYESGKIKKVDYDKKRRHLEKYNFGPSSFNHYRSYLIMLFKIIVPLANMAGNPVEDIPKEKEVKRIRETLTDEQRKAINEYLQVKHYTFWRFLHIFFHSGARESEMMRVELKHVDLKNQRFIALILKGNTYQEVWKPIKNLALPLWQELINEAKKVKADGQPIYIFSNYLKPGLDQIDEWQITKRWRVHVKENELLGNITADFYALKHLNSTETRDILGAKAAAAMNSHKSEAMVVNIYDVKREERKMEELDRLKEVNNPFA